MCFTCLFIFQGNITFRLNDDKLVIGNNSALNDTANLFSINPKDLSTALSQRVIAAGGEVMQKTHTLIEAEYGRDALAKVHLICIQFFSFFHEVSYDIICIMLTRIFINLSGNIRAIVHVDSVACQWIDQRK
jgi:hypothetical protein